MPAKACKDYCLEGRLIGHKNAINCLTISNNGSLLASGGSDGMRIWDLKRRLQLPSPRQNMGLQNPVDPVTCACWITRQEAQQGEGIEDFDAKVSRRIGTGKEIMCITYDHAGDDTRIATGTRDRRVQVWSFDFKGPLIPVFSIELNSTILRTINFNRTASRNLLVFGMYDGEVHALRGTDGVIIATNNAGPLIGHASVDNAQTLFLIDNVTNGFSLHRLDDAVCIRSYNTNPIKTDAGVIYVFDKNEGTLKQVLKHADKARVQTVTTYDGTHHSMIVGATSQNDAEPVISIWSRQRENLETARPPLGKVVKNFVRGIVQLAIAIALLAYVSHVCVTMNTSISFESLGNIWRNLARPRDPTNEDIRTWVEQYIEHREETIIISNENKLPTRRGKIASNMEMEHGESQTVILLGM
ncbi:WD40-repeat-containing domain protein [Suillus cothurnatus]|nr:WD40-repeat-containing domain protein [Suillus cothurnatus]